MPVLCLVPGTRLIFDFIPGQEWTAGQPEEAVSVVAALARLLSHVHTQESISRWVIQVPL